MTDIKYYGRCFNICIDDSMVGQFSDYCELLTEYNKFMNLTAITEPGDIYLKHFADSLAVIPFLEKAVGGSDFTNSSIADVGTGAGFPGLPLKIVLPELNVTLIDSLKKRLGFLEAVIARLSLSNVKLIHSRAEDAGNNIDLREQFDIVIARAVASMTILSEYCIPLVKTGGLFAAMKSDSSDDLNSAEFAIKKLGGVVETVHEYYLPDSDIFRTLILIRKISKTPSGYPRKAGTPEKIPLMPKCQSTLTPKIPLIHKDQSALTPQIPLIHKDQSTLKVQHQKGEGNK